MSKLTHIIVFIMVLYAPSLSHAQSFAFGGSSGGGGMTLLFADGRSAYVAATDQGWWSPTEANFGSNTNTIVGNCFGIQWNDFFVFDLSALTGTVVSATLDLNTRFVAGAPALSLWDVSTPLAILENLDAGPNAAIYADLGSGTQFSDSYTIAGSNTAIAIALNRAGLSAIDDALGGTFSIGGSADQPIPEPSPAWLLIIALAGIGAARYRPSQAAKRSALS